MSLLRDVLGVTQTVQLCGIQNENSKKQAKAKKPAGMSREVYALCGGGLVSKPAALQNPITDKKNIKAVSVWKMTAFYNSGRKDNLCLWHWAKENEETNNYPWSKYNVLVKVVKYTDEIYSTYLQNLDPSWSKEETDYLWDLCSRFDLRFHVIFDRYDPFYKRTVEDLKYRYYSVARKVTEVWYEDRIHQEMQKYNNNPPPNCIAQIRDEKSRHALLRYTYSPDLDRKRKAMLEKQYRITEEEKRRCNELNELIKKQEMRLKREEKKRDEARKLKKPFEILEEDLIPVDPIMTLKKPGSSSSGSSLLDVFRNSQLKKHSDMVENVLKSLNVPYPTVFSQNVVMIYCSLRIDIATMLNLKKKVEKLRKEKEYWEKQLQITQNTSAFRVPQGLMNVSMPAPNIMNSNMSNNLIQSNSSSSVVKADPVTGTVGSNSVVEPKFFHPTHRIANSRSGSTKKGGMISVKVNEVLDGNEIRPVKKQRKNKEKTTFH